jgi:intracellular septation protein
MKIVFDFLPLLLFFVAFRVWDVYVATVTVIVATAAQIGWLKIRRQPVPAPLWLGLVIVAVLGGATLVFHDEWFLKLKPTALYWTMGAALLGGRLLGRDLLRLVMGEQLVMPPAAWKTMSWMWIGFFAFMGAANLYVAHHYPTAAWVNFKVFWSTGLLFVFALVQGLVLARYIPDGEEKAAD